MILDGLNFSTANFCICFRLSVNYPNQPQQAVIFELFNQTTGDGFRFGSLSGIFTEGKPFIRMDENEDSQDDINSSASTTIFFNQDVNPPNPSINPLSECSLAFVNDATNNKMILKILPNDSSVVETHEILGSSHSNQFLNAKMYIGMTEIRQFNFPFKGMAGSVSHVAIYDSALTPTDVDEVLLDIKEL